MEKKKKNKKNNFSIHAYLVISLIVFIAVFAMFVATFYSYYIKNIKEDENKTVVVKNFDMLLIFENGSQVHGYNLKPGWNKIVDFSIQNFSEDTVGKYKIVLEIITPLFNMTDEDFVYELSGYSDNKDVSNRLVNQLSTPLPVITKEIGSAIITPNTTHTYQLKLKINDFADSSKYIDGNIFSAKVKIIKGND